MLLSLSILISPEACGRPPLRTASQLCDFDFKVQIQRIREHIGEIMNVANNPLNENQEQRMKSLLGLAHFQILLRDEWKSTALDYRDLIRRFLFENFSADKSILDLSQRPLLPQGSVSVSHSSLCGGFAITTVPGVSLGFDIEENERMREQVVARVSSSEELETAPSLAALWAAKEAAFKSFPKGVQPPVMSSISVNSWKKADDGFYTCEAQINSHSARAQGVVLINHRQTLSVFRYTES